MTRNGALFLITIATLVLALVPLEFAEPKACDSDWQSILDDPKEYAATPCVTECFQIEALKVLFQSQCQLCDGGVWCRSKATSVPWRRS